MYIFCLPSRLHRYSTTRRASSMNVSMQKSSSSEAGVQLLPQPRWSQQTSVQQSVSGSQLFSTRCLSVTPGPPCRKSRTG